jgi:hypothetical protein
MLKSHPGFGPNSGFWCRVFLTLWKTLIFAVVLSFAVFQCNKSYAKFLSHLLFQPNEKNSEFRFLLLKECTHKSL